MTVSDSVADALGWLAVCVWAASMDECRTPVRCRVCHDNQLDIEAAALAYDLAVSEDIARRAVAWA